jgi:7-cyano-7-deazaguanine synthase
MKSTVVPFRNGIFLSILTAYAEANNIDSIFLGNHAGDHAIYPDTRGGFINSFAVAAKRGTYQEVEVLTPFININKSDICKIGLYLNIPYEKT